MHRSLRILAFVSATAASFVASAQSQTITFSNSTPPVTVNLLNNTQVQIGTSGNLTAQCQLDSGRCVGLPTGGSGSAPTVSISASTNATTTGSTVTITATVSGAQVCERRTGTGSTGSVSGWTGFTAGTGAAAGGQVTAQSVGTYQFELKCWNDAGSTASALVGVTISQGSGGGTQPPAFCASVTPPSGFTRDTRTEWTQLFPQAISTNQNNTPPETGTTALTPVVIPAGRYLTVAFTTGSSTFLSAGGQFEWAERQTGGASAEVPNATFINFSACPGDFALRTASLGTGDINALPVCRSHRPSPTQIIQFKDAATANTLGECPLQPNTTYYVNMLWADPRDGIQPGEYHCQNNASECGLMFK